MAKGDVILQGTLDLIVLKTLDTAGPLHGYGLARHIEHLSRGTVSLNPGTIYAAVVRLLQRRWISASWGASTNNRRARFYAITASGRKQLATEIEQWGRVSTLMERVLSV